MFATLLVCLFACFDVYFLVFMFVIFVIFVVMFVGCLLVKFNIIALSFKGVFISNIVNHVK